MSTVSLQQLSKLYPPSGKTPAFHAVRGIDLEINGGEFMVLVGPSGCGKSTTLRMIAGLEEVSGGAIMIGERQVNDVLPKDRDIAMVFQNYALYPHMTVYENMAFGLTLRKLPKAEIDQRVREAAAMLGLEPYLDRKPKALSGGQRQRVAVGRAIVRKPQVFLFDEPLSNLDAKMRVSMRTEISKLHARIGATMVYVTHDQVEAMTMGDRICVMKDGEIMQVATPLALYNEPANMFVAGFIGSPPMNFFTGCVSRTEQGVVFTEENPHTSKLVLRLAEQGSLKLGGNESRRVVLGIRPEDVATNTSSENKTAAFTATVELVEPMGAETIVHLTTGVTAFIGRFPPQLKFAAGESAQILFNADKVHLFDPGSGQRL